MYLSSQSIVSRINAGDLAIRPFEIEARNVRGLSYGLGPAGYDIRIALTDQPVISLWPGRFTLQVALEYVRLPNDLVAEIKDKSTWVRRGLTVQNTVAEPGWHGYLTLELKNEGDGVITIHHGDPIAQLMFAPLDQPTDRPYRGKYQNQPARPMPAIMEEETA
jgi:dCTP deaminase